MFRYALAMLIGDRAKYLGIILGLAFASFIITQQAAIFIGLMTRTYGFITDTAQPNVWVVDPKVQYIDDIKPLKDTDVERIRGIEGVLWAVPLYKGLLKARLPNGNFQNCIVVGIDDATLIGGPTFVTQGKLQDLRAPDAIIVDEVGAQGKLALNGTPLQIGETLELNDHRAKVVGLCSVYRTFQSQPVIYTTYSRAIQFAPHERRLLSFVLVYSDNPEETCRRIEEVTGLSAYTSQGFSRLTVDYYMRYTGIPINFGVAVLLGFIIGTAIAGQTFYNFTLDNLRYFALFKAMGAPIPLLVRMILLQSIWVGSIGWGLGLGAACIFYPLSFQTELSFRLPWELLLASGVAMFAICIFAAFLSIQKIRRIDPALVFKS